MATIITNIEQSQVVTNLDTYNYTVSIADQYAVSCETSVIPPSGLFCALKQNGSTKASTPSPGAVQITEKVQIIMNCAVNDVIGVTLSSAVPADAAPNDFKSLINIRRGIF